MPADRLVKAETSLQEFVTTLTKTFAALPIGLAIFDRTARAGAVQPGADGPHHAARRFPDREAHLFGLSRPAARIADDAGAEGLQHLAPADVGPRSRRRRTAPTRKPGRCRPARPTGSPAGRIPMARWRCCSKTSPPRSRSPAGSAPSSKPAGGARRAAEAIAVFSPAARCRCPTPPMPRLWGNRPVDNGLARSPLLDAVARWQASSAPTPVWDELREFVIALRTRAPAWTARIALNDGRSADLPCHPARPGATLVDFTVAAQPRSGPRVGRRRPKRRATSCAPAAGRSLNIRLAGARAARYNGAMTAPFRPCHLRLARRHRALRAGARAAARAGDVLLLEARSAAARPISPAR